jgi:hypothetical protein
MVGRDKRGGNELFGRRELNDRHFKRRGLAADVKDRKPVIDLRRMKICRLSISGFLATMIFVSMVGNYALRALWRFLGWHYDAMLGVPLVTLTLIIIVSWRCDDDCS